MRADTYFKKHGEIYGIEQPDMLCGYATESIRFTNFEKAQMWVHENVDTYRFLGTKTDTKHLGNNEEVK